MRLGLHRYLFKLKFVKEISENKHFQEILRGSISTLILRFIGLVSSYLLFYVLSKYFGAETVGVYSLSISVLSIVSVLGAMGMNTAILRFSAQYGSQGAFGSIKIIYKRMVSVILPVSFCLSLILYYISNFLADTIFDDSSLSFAFKLVAVILPFFVLCNLNAEALRGLKKIKESEFFRTTGISLTSLIVLLVISVILFCFNIESNKLFQEILSNYLFKPPLTGVFCYSFSVIIIFLFSMFFLNKRLKKKKNKVVDHDKLTLQFILKTSLPMFMTASMYLLMGHTDKLVIGFYDSTEEVGIYNVSLKLATITAFMLTAINSIIAPKFAELFYQKKMVEFERVVKFSSKMIFWSSCPILLAFLFFPVFFLGLFGEEFVVGKWALLFLVFGQFVNAISGSVGQFLNMTGKQIISRNIMGIAAIINIILNFVLVPHFGIAGAAISTTISTIFWNLLSVIYIFQHFNIRTIYFPFLK